MITIENMMSIDKNNIQEASKMITKADIANLIEWLSLKDDNIRYQAFLLVQNRSLFYDDIYPYWDILLSKLKSDNSYQRSIGLTLIAENVKWDVQNKIDETIDEYFKRLNDEKPITIRQCIQSLGKIALCKPCLHDKIADRLVAFDLISVKDTMRKSVLLDILNVLLIIRKNLKTNEIEDFIIHALTGDILDKKSKKLIEAQL